MTDAYHLRELRVSYGDNIAIDISELTVPAYSVTALVGANGSGKTTLLTILALLKTADSGQLELFGQPLAPEQLSRQRRRIGYVHQKPYLFNTTVRRNLELPLKWQGLPAAVREHRIGSVTERFQLQDLLPRPAHTLSGGEAQKTALARALILEPDVLLLDEPFSHLDRRFRAEMEELIRRLRQDRTQTLVFSTHDPVQAQTLADNVCSLVAGYTIPVSVVNVFSGICTDNWFDTGQIRVLAPRSAGTAMRLAIDSNQIVLSTVELTSSMRNRYRGILRQLVEADGEIHATVDAGETFHVTITAAALRELRINVGDTVWVSFKSSAVHIF